MPKRSPIKRSVRRNSNTLYNNEYTIYRKNYARNLSNTSQAGSAKKFHGIVRHSRSLPNITLRDIYSYHRRHSATTSSYRPSMSRTSMSRTSAPSGSRSFRRESTGHRAGFRRHKHKTPPWVHPNAFFRNAPDPEPRHEAPPGFICGQIHGFKKLALALYNRELRRFIYCIPLRTGCFIIAALCLLYSLLCLTMLILIFVFFRDWLFVYEKKLDLLVFIMSHLAMRVLLAAPGIILIVGVIEQSDLLLKISLYGFWAYIAFNWLALGTLTVFCSVEGYCFFNQTFPTVLFLFFITLVYSYLGLYAVWTVNSYIDTDDDDDY